MIHSNHTRSYIICMTSLKYKRILQFSLYIQTKQQVTLAKACAQQLRNGVGSAQGVSPRNLLYVFSPLLGGDCAKD